MQIFGRNSSHASSPVNCQSPNSPRQLDERYWFASLDFNLTGITLLPVDVTQCVNLLPELSAGLLLFDILIANCDRHQWIKVPLLVFQIIPARETDRTSGSWIFLDNFLESEGSAITATTIFVPLHRRCPDLKAPASVYAGRPH